MLKAETKISTYVGLNKRVFCVNENEKDINKFKDDYSYSPIVSVYCSAGMMGEGLLTLTYGKHHACILNEVGAAWRGARYSDLVLVCDDAVPLAAHRIVMAAASPLIRYGPFLLCSICFKTTEHKYNVARVHN